MDDVLVFSSTFEEHLSRLDTVLSAIGQAGLTLNPKKCRLASADIAYLGHLVDFHGIPPLPEKTRAVGEFPTPENITQLRSFLDLASAYRRFVRGFAEITCLLHQLLKKGADAKKD